jgi:hypothetical protein
MGTRLTIPIARYSAFRPNECVKFVADYDDEWAFEYTILVNGEEKEERRLDDKLVIPYMLRLLLEAKTVQIKGFQVASLMVL